MATFNRKLGIAFGTQSVEGVADTTIAALSGTLGLADGIILGDTASGIAGSGISHSFERRLREKGPVAAGFTLQASDFLEEVISLSFSFPLAGARQVTTTPTDAELRHDPGIDELFAACGLVGAASTFDPIVGWKYIPDDVVIATAKLFDSDFFWVIRDIRGNWSFNLTPGEVGIATVTLSGIVDDVTPPGLLAFPTFNYGVQGTVSAPNISGTAPSWGMGSLVRGWTDLTISCENAIESIPDSASSTGSGFEQSGRTITVEMTIKDDTFDVDFTRAELVSGTAPISDLVAEIGGPTAPGGNGVGYRFNAANIEVRNYTPAVAGKKAASQITGVCTGTTDGSEFFIAND